MSTKFDTTSIPSFIPIRPQAYSSIQSLYPSVHQLQKQCHGVPMTASMVLIDSVGCTNMCYLTANQQKLVADEHGSLRVLFLSF